MSLHPEPIGEVPAETARVSRAAFPKGTLVTRRRRRAAHPGHIQPHGLRRLRRPGAVHAVKGRAPLDLLPPAPQVRGAEYGTGADGRPRMETALPRAGRDREHALARRARVRHAPEPIHRLGQDRAAAGLHGRRDERLADRELAGWPAAGQNTRDALRRPGPGRLSSPTVSRSSPPPIADWGDRE